jgi:hypothetical protein
MTNQTVPNPFDPAALRLDQSYADTVGVKKLLTTVPVRKPNRQDFVRVHADPAPRSAGEQLWLKTLMQFAYLVDLKLSKQSVFLIGLGIASKPPATRHQRQESRRAGSATAFAT